MLVPSCEVRIAPKELTDVTVCFPTSSQQIDLDYSFARNVTVMNVSLTIARSFMTTARSEIKPRLDRAALAERRAYSRSLGRKRDT